MSNKNQWSQRITENAQFKQISKVAEKLRDAEIEHPNLDAKVSFDRLLKGVSRLDCNIRSIDLDLLAPQVVQTIHGQFSALNTQASSYITNLNPAHINSAHSNLDALTQTYPFLFVSQGVETTAEYKEQLEDFNHSANGYLGALNKAKEKLNDSVNQLNTQATSFQKELAKYQQELSSLRQENTNISTQQNETFIKSQQERDEDYKQTKETIHEAVDIVVQEKSTLFKENLAHFEKRATAGVDEIQEKLEEAKRTFENLGVVVQTGKYQEFADKEGKVAGWLRIGAIIALILMFAGTVAVIISAEREQLPWNLFLLRFLTVATLSIPAFYFARESTRHRDKEHHYRKIQLELTSLTPFIEFFDVDSKKEIKRSLIEKYFGKEEAPAVNDDQMLTKKDLMELLTKIPTN